MDATTGVGGTTGRAGTNEVDYTALTPEALLTYCTASLRDIDTSIHTRLGDQRRVRASAAALGDLQSYLNELAKDKKKESDIAIAGEQKDVLATINAKLELAIKNAPPGVREELQRTYDAWKANPGDHNYNVKEVRDLAESLRVTSEKFSKSTEIDMIHLQSLMSQRQTHVQLVTNIMSSLHDSLKAIAMKVAG